MEGYYGLNWAFLAFFLLAISSVVPLILLQANSLGIGLFFLLLILAVVAVGVLSYPNNKKIGYGLNWSDSAPLWISIGMSIGSVIISPVIVFIVLQLIAMAEIKNYGIKGGFFGVRKKDIKAKIEEMKRQTTAAPYQA